MNKPLTITLCLITAVLLTGASARGVGPARGQDLMPGVIQGQQRKCLDCHRERNTNTNEGVLSSNAFCNECHGQDACQRIVDGKPVSLKVPLNVFENTRHEYAACLQCHPDLARSRHQSSTGVQCLGCHEPHGERQAHDPHVGVRCEACHTDSKFVERDPVAGVVRLARVNNEGARVNLTEHRMTKDYTDQFCQRCHYSGNRVGAAATALPAKSALCIMCHNAPFSMGHWMFWAAFSIGILGFVGTATFWFRGAVGGEESSTHRKLAAGSETVWRTVFSRRIFSLAKTFFFDVLLQRRMLRESVRRWSIHSLIYFAFLGRLFLSLLIHFFHSVAPLSETGLALIDKNYYLTAFVYDLLGFFILLGVVWAAVLRFVSKPQHVLTEEQDSVSLIFIGLIVLSGFVLEGARISVTQVPAHVAAFAFVGWIGRAHV